MHVIVSHSRALRGALALVVAIHGLSHSPRAAAQAVPAAQLGFPLQPLALGAHGAVEYAPIAARVDALHALERATLEDCVLPTADGLVSLDLELRRLPDAGAQMLVSIDGRAAQPTQRRSAAFVGAVVGEPGSNLFLALTDSGLRGWIERASGRIELDSHAGEQGAWSDWRVLALDATASAALRGGAPWACATPAPAAPVPVPSTPVPASSASPSAAATGGSSFATGPLLCKVALETDYQFYQHFNDLGAAEDYARTLTNALSSRLWAQAQIVVQLPYLGLYSSSNDPWTIPDVGGDMLGEFTSAWQNQIPGGAHIAHFISGGLYFGGVAYVDVICNSWWGFGVSTGITGGTPFPVVPSWMTWDFFVYAHEIGHQLGSWHTHDYCPPLDSCAAGTCVTQTACSEQGTIMSYCHTCGAGMANITTWYHPTNAQIIRQSAEASCMGGYSCSACNCPWPSMSFVSPFPLAPYTGATQTVTVTGCHFEELTEVRVDGVALPQSAWKPTAGTSMSFAMPLVSKTGSVDLELESAWGTQLAYLWVIPQSTPALGMTYANEDLHWWLSALDTQYTIGGAPGDLVYFLGSFSGQPTNVPGIVSLGIGNQLASLYVLKTSLLGASAWTSQVLPLDASLAGAGLYFQAAALRNATLPLLTSPVASGVVLF